ncbi:MAG: serine/threonine protein kinase, partial [Planctomycetaceae bacterium]|nr:serine/threonine protein kinase [Planctomycetaceae bacterium]
MESGSHPSDEEIVAEELCAYQERIDAGHPVAADQMLTQNTLPKTVQDSLAGLKRCLELVNKSGFPSASSDTIRSSPSPPGYAVPDRIGKYEITGTYGVGGHGIVFKGIDPSTNRVVAIKVPKPEQLTNLDLVERFAHEASAAAQLDHPNIVPIFDCDRYGTVPFLVMPFIRGETLHQWMSKQRLIEFRVAAELVRQLAEGLAHAHERKILHRDLKPGNILLQPRAGERIGEAELPFIPRVTDFGLAKSTDATHGKTTTGSVLGTVGYMSPEQANGLSKQIREESDL